MRLRACSRSSGTAASQIHVQCQCYKMHKQPLEALSRFCLYGDEKRSPSNATFCWPRAPPMLSIRSKPSQGEPSSFCYPPRLSMPKSRGGFHREDSAKRDRFDHRWSLQLRTKRNAVPRSELPALLDHGPVKSVKGTTESKLCSVSLRNRDLREYSALLMVGMTSRG